MTLRSISQLVPAVEITEGAGVTVHRTIGTPALKNLDPFLLLDHFGSEDPDDYIAGFPDHPHRGFEVITYLFSGAMRHRDNLGNDTVVSGGGAMVFTAGRGIVHSEMPQQQEGRMRGFQLWINLPAREKMKPAGYRDLQPEDIPSVALAGGGPA